MREGVENTGHPPDPLHHGVVHVWWARLGCPVDHLAALLNAGEAARRKRFRRAEDADRFLLGSAVVRLAAARYLGQAPERVEVDRRCPRCGEPHGKVRLPGTGIEVSVSHSGDLVGVAFHRGVPVGLDVEYRDRRLDPDALADTVLTGREAEALRAAPPEQRNLAFLRYWTRKEAIVKATGDGLDMPLSGLEVTAHHAPAALLSWPARPELAGVVQVRDLAGDARHAAALAVLGDQPVAVHELDACEILCRR